MWTVQIPKSSSKIVGLATWPAVADYPAKSGPVVAPACEGAFRA
jgi:hypothetical protein